MSGEEYETVVGAGYGIGCFIVMVSVAFALIMWAMQGFPGLAN
jgi:hypothetical protein